MAYTTIDNPELYFQAVLWTANGSNPRTITFGGDENMQPDLLWYKCRSAAVPHILYDSVRGFGNDKEVSTNDGLAQGGQSSETDGFISAVTSDGFTLAAGASGGDHYTNEGSRTFVAWGWKESADAGFDIVSMSGTGSARTQAHSLSAVPEWIFVKELDNAGSWYTYTAMLGNTKAMFLNATNAVSADSSGYWNDTTPTSSVFSLGTDGGVNQSSTAYVAYLFRSVQGFSKFSSFKGNSDADGTFVYTGFSPAFVMLKATSGGEGWYMVDNKRQGFNPENEEFFANSNGVEGTSNRIDLLSNGFKLRDNNSVVNASAITSYIYMAFAKAPFVNSKGVPANAK